MKKFYLTLFILAICPSCIEDLEIQNNSEPRLFLNCILSADSNLQTATLGVVGSVFDKKNSVNYKFDYIKDAKVSLLADGELVGDFQSYNERWYLDYQPQVGVEYEIVAEVQAFEKLRATTTMPQEQKVIILEDEVLDKNINRPTFLLRYPLCEINGGSRYWLFYASRSNAQLEWDKNTAYPYRFEYIATKEIGSDHPNLDANNRTRRIVNYDDEIPIHRGEFFVHEFYLKINEHQTEGSVSFDVECITKPGNAFWTLTMSQELEEYFESGRMKAQIYLEYPSIIAGYETNSVYSNIEGGFGIFGAINEYKYETKSSGPFNE